MSRILIFLILAGLSRNTLAQDKSYSAETLPGVLTEQADAVVRSESMTVELLALDRMETTFRQVLTVLNKRGDRHVRLAVAHNNDRQVQQIAARIFDASGRETDTFKKRDFQDASAVSGGTLYSDSRIMYLDYTPVAYPYTVEFTYQTRQGNTSPLPRWYFLGGYRVSTEKSSITMRWADPMLRPDVLERHLDTLKVDRLEAAGSLSYSVESIPAIRREPLSPSFREIAPMVYFRPVNFSYEGITGKATDWESLGEWMQTHMLRDRDQLPESTVRLAQGLVGGEADPIEKARIIYKYVQEHTRYISVQVGIGGIRPIEAAEVDRVKYGDCKGLSNYTRALLRAVGVPSYYVHVEAGARKFDFEPEFPDLAQGNHAILAIPDGDQLHWIDCTSQTLPFGYLGDFTDDRLAHVMSPGGGNLVRTPVYADTLNSQETLADIVLDGDGNLKAGIRIQTRGTQYGDHYSLATRTPRELSEHYRRSWGHLANLQLLASDFGNDRREVAFTEELSIAADHYARVMGERMFLSVNPLNRIDYVPDGLRERKLPFEVVRGYRDKESYRVALPDGYRPEALPEPKYLQTDFGAYEMAVEYLPEVHQLHFTREIVIRGGVFPAATFEAYREFRKEIARSESAQAVLIKTKT